MKKLFKIVKDDKGATAIEYGLIAALIAVAAIAGVSSAGIQVGSTFNKVGDKMEEATTTPAADQD